MGRRFARGTHAAHRHRRRLAQDRLDDLSRLLRREVGAQQRDAHGLLLEQVRAHLAVVFGPQRREVGRAQLAQSGEGGRNLLHVGDKPLVVLLELGRQLAAGVHERNEYPVLVVAVPREQDSVYSANVLWSQDSGGEQAYWWS